MKIQFLVIFLSFLCSIFSQNTSSNATNLQTEAVACAIMADGKKVIVGNLLVGDDVFISLCDINNDPIWTLPIRTNQIEKVNGVAIGKNGEIMMVGTMIKESQTESISWIACVSSTGDLTWKKEWGTKKTIQLKAIQATQDGEFCVVGYITNANAEHDAWVGKIDVEGREVWSKASGWDKTDEFTACATRLNGNLLLAGFTTKEAGLKDILLMETDMYGKVIRMRVYGKGESNEEATSVQETPYNQVIICGRTNERNPSKTDTDGKVWLLDEIGKVTWSDIQGGDNMDSYFSVACKTNAFTIVGTTIVENTQNTKGWTISYNYKGEKLWDNIWDTFLYFTDIIPTESGWCINGTQDNNNELYANILLIDDLGYAETVITSQELLPNELAITDNSNVPATSTEIKESELPAHINQEEKDTSDKHISTEIAVIDSKQPVEEVVVNEKPKKEHIVQPVTRPKKDIDTKTKEEVTSADKAVNNSEGISLQLTIGEDGANPTNNEKLQNIYVISVGISHYQNKNFNIRYSASDAELFALSMTNMEGNGFNKINIQILTNEQANLANIEQALDMIQESSKDNDLICIYLTGRGYFNPSGIPYLMMNDEHETTDEASTPNLDLHSFLDRLKNIKGEKVLFTDFFVDPTITYPTTKWVHSIESNRISFISSVTEDEIALEKSEWGHSAFSKTLLEGLAKKADTDNNFFIYFSELVNYLNTEIPSLTHDLQHPQVILSPSKDVMMGVYR